MMKTKRRTTAPKVRTTPDSVGLPARATGSEMLAAKVDWLDGVGRPVVISLTTEAATLIRVALQQSLDDGSAFDDANEAKFIETLCDELEQEQESPR